MEDILISIVAKLAEYTVGPILNHARYLCCFNNFAENLLNAKEELELTRNSVMKRVEETTKRTEKIEPAVEKWLKDVEQVLEEVHKKNEKILKVSNSYFRRRCQYFLAKEIADIIKRMNKLNDNSKFEPFSKITELPGMKYFSSKDFVLFKSTESTLKELLEALKDKNVSMIGLVGLGGAGKTTLAKEVGKKAEELRLFDKVVMATVSETPNIRNIQAQIADNLNFTLYEESEEGRAKRLSERLREGTTLLILDDVWEKLNFEAIGIPFNENNKGCGVLITTRSREVCTSMQCQSVIELNLLTGEEAWELFKFNANITDDSPYELKGVATQIVDECKGLPIAIVTVGNTLKGKTLEDWKSALSRLQESKPLVIPKGLRSPHACLQLSYDNLTDELSKSLFLLCSMFPEDHEIDLEDLFRFGSGRGLFGTSVTMEKARREMRLALNILMDSCLLSHTNKKERVKMHDMVRDVALWIASEKGQGILASTGMDLQMLVEDETIIDKRVISLWELKNGQLPSDDQLNCPTLEVLLFHSPKLDFNVSNACLERLKMIKILAFLTCGYGWTSWISKNPTRCTLPLPQSIESLKNLRTLCLRGFSLGDISILESLQALEILDLRGSIFKELPNGIPSLKKLKLLDLFYCLIQENNAYEVIGRCLQLNELYLYIVSYVYQKFPHNVSFPRLERYALISEMYSWHLQSSFLEEHRPSRTLCIDGFNASAQSFISLPIKDFFLRAEYLHLKNLNGGYKNLIPSMDPQGMNQLIFLRLESCQEIECWVDDSSIITNTNEDVFSSLVTITLLEMHRLQQVFCDHSSQCSLKQLQELTIEYCNKLYNISFPKNLKLCNLKVLVIGNCPMLTCIFKPSIVQTLELLEVLQIYHCYELKHIIEEVEEGNADYFTSQSQSHTFNMLPKLRRLLISDCNELKYIFPMCYGQGLVSLKDVAIGECRELKYVFGSEKEHDLSMYQQQINNIHINFLELDDLNLKSLPNLLHIWPSYCLPGLPNLKKFCCCECPRLSHSSICKALIDSDTQLQDTTPMEKEILWLVAATFNQMSSHALKLNHLELSYLELKGLFQYFHIEEPGSIRELVPLNVGLVYINLFNLYKLKFIWKGPTNFLSLHVLDRICVDRCPKLKTIFSPTIVKSLPMLRRLKISNCEELEQIFDSGGDEQELKNLYTCYQQVCFPTLQWIEVQNCNNLKFLFYNLVAGDFCCLTTLKIEECSQLQKVFAFEHEDGDDGEEGPSKDGEQGLLHKLEDITFTSLPNFKEIHHKFKLRDHVEHTITDCPKYAPSIYLHPVP